MLKEVDKTSSPRAGRRKLDGSDNFSPSDLIHTKDALHKSAGRFSYGATILDRIAENY